MMNNVMTNIPQAVWSQGGQECDTTQYFIKLTIRREALMASVMAQNKDSASNKAGNNAKNNFQKNVFYKYCPSNAAKP